MDPLLLVDFLLANSLEVLLWVDLQWGVLHSADPLDQDTLLNPECLLALVDKCPWALLEGDNLAHPQ